MVNANNVDRALMRFEFLQVCLSTQPHPNPNPNPCPNPSPRPHSRPAPNLTPTPLGPDACRHRVLPIYHPYHVCTQRQPKPPPQTSSHPQHQPQLQPYIYRPWYVLVYIYYIYRPWYVLVYIYTTSTGPGTPGHRQEAQGLWSA
jgi:hypothetical protein